MTILYDDQPLPNIWERLIVFSAGRMFLIGTALFLILCDRLAPDHSLMVDLCAIIVLGLPHGALDPEIARDRLISRLGRWWFPLFAVPYLALAEVVLLAWHIAPIPALVAFLALSVWHFGEARDANLLRILVRGGAPIALPVLFHPTATAALLAGISQTVLSSCPAWLMTASYGWIVFAVLELSLRQRHRELIAELALITILYAALSPLTALAIYFVCLHSPAHMSDLTQDSSRASRVTSIKTAILRAFPITLLTVVIGLLLWPLYHGDTEHRLLALTIQGLAALTLPHMMLDRAVAWMDMQRLNTCRPTANSR